MMLLRIHWIPFFGNFIQSGNLGGPANIRHLYILGSFYGLLHGFPILTPPLLRCPSSNKSFLQADILDIIFITPLCCKLDSPFQLFNCLLCKFTPLELRMIRAQVSKAFICLPSVPSQNDGNLRLFCFSMSSRKNFYCSRLTLRPKFL